MEQNATEAEQKPCSAFSRKRRLMKKGSAFFLEISSRFTYYFNLKKNRQVIEMEIFSMFRAVFYRSLFIILKN